MKILGLELLVSYKYGPAAHNCEFPPPLWFGWVGKNEKIWIENERILVEMERVWIEIKRISIENERILIENERILIEN